MTAYYEPKDEAYLEAKQERAGALHAIELFMCSDGNYRDANAKAAYEKQRLELLSQYSSG